MADWELTILQIDKVMVVKHDGFLRIVIGLDFVIDIFAKGEDDDNSGPELEVTTVEALNAENEELERKEKEVQ